MKYISTRSKEKEYNFGEVFLKGLADDGGLYVPKSVKKYSKENGSNIREKILNFECHTFSRNCSISTPMNEIGFYEV